ncbi:ketopantoate reductase family protein [Nocardiopsis sediminis]|uniref:Ketopantoate reductase family protein n=1 Tax=Nocardiopsis sediminis TaxID=1778267 RepID=A0ABV8FJ80_9ACTN
MRILMFGRGVVAAVYGWALAGAGHDVEFYVRPGRANAYGESMDVDILDSRRKGRDRHVREAWSPRYCEELAPEHDFDLIVLSVPHDRLPGAIEFLSTRIGNATVLMFSNMWEEPLDVVAPLPLGQVAWGFPQGGGGYDDTGRLRAALIPGVLFGSFNEALTERELAARGAFRQAGFRVREQADIRGWLLLHTAAGASLYSQALRHGTMADLIGNMAALREAMLVGRELLPVVEARGVDLRRHWPATLPYRLPSWLPAAALSLANRTVPIVHRTFEAHADPDAEEPRVVCRDVLAEARRLGVPTPGLSAAAPAFMPDQSC